MSLDVKLIEDGVEVFSANITHNLTKMASEAGFYQALWHPEEFVHGRQVEARDIYYQINGGFHRLATSPTYYKTFDAPNGWGLYHDFLPWIAIYMEALRKHPNAIVLADR